jgi:hypothetical protein
VLPENVAWPTRNTVVVLVRSILIGTIVTMLAVATGWVADSREEPTSP